ncbi:MAG TPA: aminopeptidase P N-terminal domain-containing protein [Candidatus Saccharimonadales bacterium]|nr:aminopeptidase P N-terminal domain-containing protein [Candidatus Saccharimonadales bacterium]
MRYKPIDPILFIDHRQRLRQWLKPGQAVMLRAAKLMRRSGDTDYPFRQNSDFFWATGIDQPDSAVILASDQEMLFIREATEFEVTWIGPRLSAEQASAISGIKTVKPLDQFERYRKELKAKAPRRALIDQLRAIKDPIEIDLMKRAIEITKDGFTAALRATKPGAKEYQLEAELMHQFGCHGTSYAYESIVASGANANILHYITNNQKLRDGDLVLIDAGAEYANYAADITRVWPVSGQFSKRQRAIYEAVLRIQRASIDFLRPGVSLLDFELNMAELMTEEMIGLHLFTQTDVKNQDPKKPLIRRYWPHASHFLGLDVHDVGDRSKPLKPGMVLTCEPGIYIKAEGIGIRLEDDILITAEGPLNLSAAIPIDPDEIEALMTQHS